MKKITLLFLLLPFLGLSQVQIGEDILGENGQLGFDVSISENGNIIAVGSPSTVENGDLTGNVKIFENLNGVWTQIGQDIVGEYFSGSGTSIDISSDGTIIAIGSYFDSISNGNGNGHVRIFENQGGNWAQIGQDIVGEAYLDQFGRNVSLSANGNIVAIGAPHNLANSQPGYRSGHVRVFENQGSNWVQIGQDIDGESEQDESGSSVSLSANGNIVAIGAPYNSEINFHFGHVRVYEYQGGNWVQVGLDIDPEPIGDTSILQEFGGSVSLNANGNIVAIGARLGGQLSTSLLLSGNVRVFENQGGNWVQLGPDILGDFDNDNFGYSVSLSANGNILTASAIKNDINLNNSGQVKVFSYNNSEWVQVGNDILGEFSGIELGYSLDISSDGNSIILGAPSFNVNSGLVKVYSISSELALFEVVEDIFGNVNGENITAIQLNSIEGVSGAIEGVNYTTGLQNGTFVDPNNPTPAEIQFIINQVNNALSIEDNELLNFNLYPNPTKNQFTIQLNKSSILEKVTIYNTLGQLVLTSENSVVDTSKLASGSYIIEITTNNGKASKKLIIE